MEENFQFLNCWTRSLFDLFLNLFVSCCDEVLITLFSASFGMDGEVLPIVTILVEFIFGIEIILSKKQKVNNMIFTIRLHYRVLG